MPLSDNKFNLASDGNWHPELADTAVQRSSKWEDGLGRGDIEKNKKERRRLETKRDANERYHAQIERNAADRENQDRARKEFHRFVELFCLKGSGENHLIYTYSLKNKTVPKVFHLPARKEALGWEDERSWKRFIKLFEPHF